MNSKRSFLMSKNSEQNKIKMIQSIMNYNNDTVSKIK